ncbi:MAG TPA: hypothetical protein VFF36_11640 [Planctomycetota bacterium]|jgi:hypothetical protein|nr:hypothetical protein [Planctomycetota bacterium]
MMPIARTLSALLAMGLPAAAQAAASATPPAAAPLGAAERANLNAAERADLQDLRAAAIGPAVRLDASERALLREAASRHPELANLRAGAGDFGPSPRDIMVILSALTAAVVVLSWIL